MTAFLHQVSDAFYIPPEDDDEPIFLDRLTAMIYNLGADPATFLIDPETKEFEAWMSSFKVEAQQDDIEALLANNEKLRQNLETLVPEKVSGSKGCSTEILNYQVLYTFRFLWRCSGVDTCSVFR